jgi:chromate reductase
MMGETGAFWPVPMMARSTPLSDRPHPAATPRLLLFPASLRQQSHQRRLIDHFAALLRGTCHIDILTADQVDLPLFNQDLEGDAAVLDRVISLHARWRAADGFIVASPEYNAHVSPYLKNTVDWISRLARIDARYAEINPFGGKPLLLASASTGWTGGVLGLRDARSLFSYVGCLVSPEEICVSHADHWAADGPFRFEPPFTGFIECTLSAFVKLAERLAGPVSPEGKPFV